MNRYPEMNLSTRQTFSHFLLVPLLLFFLLVLSYVNFQRMDNALRQRRQSYEVLLERSHMSNSLVSMETAVRGFVVTRNERFLEPYHKGHQDFQESLAILLNQTGLRPWTQEKLGSLQDLENRWRATQREIIAMRRRTASSVQALEMFQKNVIDRKAMMDAMRETLSDIETRETAILEHQTREVERLKKLMTATLLGGGIISILLAAYLATMITRAMRDLQSSNRALQKEIGERERAEAAQLESERRFRAIFNNTFQFTGLLLPDGTLLEANETALHFAGITREEAIGLPFWEARWWTVSEETQQQLREAIGKAAQGEFIRYEVRVKGSGDSTSLIDFSLKPVFDDEGNVVLLIPEGRDITEQKEIQRQLNEVQGRWQSVFESSRYPIVYATTDIGYMDFNRAYCELTGYSREELMGLNFKEITPPEYHRMEDEAVARILKTGQAETYEKEYIRKDGTRVWIEHTAFPVKDGDTLRGIAAIMADITKRKNAENELMRSRERLELVVRGTNDGIWDWDLKTNEVYYSSRWKEMLGYTDDEIQGHIDEWKRLVHPDDLEPATKKVEAYISGALESYELEHRLLHKDGNYRWIFARGVVLRDEEGNPYRLAGANQDLTERISFEKALSESQRALSTLMSNLPGMAYRCLNDENWTVIFVSEGCLELTGYNSAELGSGGKLGYADVIHSEDRDTVWQTVQEGLQKRQPFEMTYRIHHRDGTEKWVWEQGQGIWNEEGVLEAIEGLVLDVSERRQAEEALAQSLEELKRSNRELEEFAYVASHDLQEPLRAVGGCVQVLQRRYKDQLDDRAEDLIRHAVEGSGRMQNLINDLLQYSRVGTRGKPLEPTNTNRVLDEVLRTLRPVIEESGAQIHRDELPQVMADSNQLGQVFQNLITNALKFRGEQTPEITIGANHHIGEDGHTGEWIFQVRDNGIGIAPEYSERIFVMFQRLHTRAEYPGTGIGLAICKKIVERHGGRIWLESEVGQGTTFFFALPDVPKPQLQDGDL